MDGAVVAANDALTSEAVRAELDRLTEAHRRRGVAGAAAETAALAEILKRAKAAHARARALNGVDAPLLDRAAMVIFARARHQRLHDAAALLLAAERNWSDVALVRKTFSAGAALHAASAAAGGDSARDMTDIYRVLAALAQRGVRLSATEDGGIAAAPARLLNDTDKRLLRQHRQAFYELLTDEVIFA